MENKGKELYKESKDKLGSVKNKEIKISDYICDHRDNKGIKSKWLAEKIETSESNFSYKLSKDNLTAWELMILSIELDIDLNKIKDEIKKQLGR